MPYRSLNKNLSVMLDVISQLGEEILFFTLVPFVTNFIFMGCFEVGTEDLMFLIEDIILLMTVFKTLS